MRITLTNDDGYDAPGLRALYEAVAAWNGVEVEVVAPARVQSGKSHSLSNAFSCRVIDRPSMGRVTVVDGTPADCVRCALTRSDRPRPDWILAGINRGGNLGVDIYYSGTVAAAREAAICGIKAIAISQLVVSGEDDDWPTARGAADGVLAALCQPDRCPPAAVDGDLFEQTRRQVADLGTGDGATTVCWNVNLPKCPAGTAMTGVRLVPASTDPLPLDYDRAEQDDGTHRLAYAGRYADRITTPGTDVHIVFHHGIAISPLAPFSPE